jgi:hypothetical protein
MRDKNKFWLENLKLGDLDINGKTIFVSLSKYKAPQI